MTVEFDIVVVGAGIAGASAAAELAAHARVALLDMEAQPGFHATGRSAAFFAPSYGSDVVRGITAASEHFFRNPPAGFSDVELIRPRDALFIARADQLDRLDDMKKEIPDLHKLTAEATCMLAPILDGAYVAGGMLDDKGGDLDVDAILQAYLRLFRRRDGQLMCRQHVEAMRFRDGIWTLQSGDRSISAPVLVNAAGAWAGIVAELAGASSLQLQPMKRTAVLIDMKQLGEKGRSVDISRLPLIVDADEQFYFKPDAGQLLVSPADESPSAPCDAQPDELDIAIAVDRFQQATALNIERVGHSWAGLRTFSLDRNFIVGFDPQLTGFFWLAGQGGYGVQSAPGLAQLTTTLITGAALTGEFSSVLNYKNEVAPERFLRRG